MSYLDPKRRMVQVANGNMAYCFTDEEREEIFFMVAMGTIKDTAETWKVSPSVIRRIIRRDQ